MVLNDIRWWKAERCGFDVMGRPDRVGHRRRSRVVRLDGDAEISLPPAEAWIAYRWFFDLDAHSRYQLVRLSRVFDRPSGPTA